MDKIVIEVGSTVTKVDGIKNDEIIHIKSVTITFKKNYKENGNKLKIEDIDKLIEIVNEEDKSNLFVCGTSIFRDLKDEQKEEFLTYFKSKTGLDFNIISSEEENIYTVKGSTKVVKEALIFVGGGGSTEMSYVKDGRIVDMSNNNFGVMDVMHEFPDLSEDIATSKLEDVMNYIRQRIQVPDIQTDIMILAGGGHGLFARESGVRYEKNSLYEDKNEPIMMDISTRIEDTKRYYTEISMEEIKSRVEDPAWWFATRAMCAFVLVVAEKIHAKYIVPTDISMIYGIV